jgi:hypothetical protein
MDCVCRRYDANPLGVFVSLNFMKNISPQRHRDTERVKSKFNLAFADVFVENLTDFSFSLSLCVSVVNEFGC